LGSAGQNALLERTRDLRADIVVAGLPAADQPLSDALLEAIHPQLVIVADSEFPISERAGPKLRARLGSKNVPVLYTRDIGAVSLEFRDHYWELRTVSGSKLCSTQPNLRSAVEALSGPARVLPVPEDKSEPIEVLTAP
jgi:beta-lactamase superfamily II metal-dependent hydrolase